MLARSYYGKQKAWVAALGNLIAQGAAAAFDASPEVQAAISLLVTTFVVWLVPNKEKEA